VPIGDARPGADMRQRPFDVAAPVET
jgi:hypothetical protein